MSRKLILSALGLLAFGPAAFAITYSGVVATDFASLTTVTEPDPVDVGVASNAPPFTISGWDLERAVFNLDLGADQLHIGLDFYVIAGDADGNGGEGTTSPWLAANTGIDLAGLAQTESICMAFDFDQDGSYEVIAGTGASDGLHRVSTFVGIPLLPSFGFGAMLPAHQGPNFYSPSALTPDYEMTLDNVSGLLTMMGTETCFDYIFFGGSYQDDGVGEDFMSGTVCLEDGDVSAVVPITPELVRAYPNPFNPTTTLSLDVAVTGYVELTIFNLGGQRVGTLVDGLMSAGSHDVRFDASHLPSGLYLARLSTESGVHVTRLTLTK